MLLSSDLDGAQIVYCDGPRTVSYLQFMSAADTLRACAGAIFMFPKVLAAGAFSLLAGTDSCAMSIGVVLQPDGSVEDPTISPSRIRCDMSSRRQSNSCSMQHAAYASLLG